MLGSFMRFDVAVVGGGSTGTAIAYYLTKNGAGRVVLVEKDFVGWGQTGRSTAVVRLHYSTKEVALMALTSWRVLKDMDKTVGGESGFRASGFVILVGAEDFEGLKKNVEMHRSLGINTKIVGPDELREIEPRINVEGIYAGAYEPESGYADPVLTSQSFAKAALANGCTLMERCEVVGVKVNEKRIEKLITSKGDVEADIVVNATGVWCNRFFDLIGLSYPVTVVKEKIVVWRRPESFSGQHLVVGDLPNNYYMRPFGETQTYMGTINPETDRQEKYPEKFDLAEKVGVDTASHYGELVSKRFPIMSEAQFAGGWIGLYDITPDWHPIIGFSSKIKNLFNAVGLSGHGFKLCPAIGMLASDIILNRKDLPIDKNFFGEKRFEEKRLIGISYKYGVIS